MKRGLAIDISAININFIVVQKSNNVVHIRMRNGMEHDVASNLFNLANHILNNLIIIIRRTDSIILSNEIKFLIKIMFGNYRKRSRRG